MAGRPRTMLKRITELTDRAKAFADDLWALMPDQYGEQYLGRRAYSSDPVSEAWLASMTAAAETHRCLTELGELLANKVEKADAAAASREPGPS